MFQFSQAIDIKDFFRRYDSLQAIPAVRKNFGPEILVDSGSERIDKGDQCIVKFILDTLDLDVFLRQARLNPDSKITHDIEHEECRPTVAFSDPCWPY